MPKPLYSVRNNKALSGNDFSIFEEKAAGCMVEMKMTYM